MIQMKNQSALVQACDQIRRDPSLIVGPDLSPDLGHTHDPDPARHIITAARVLSVTEAHDPTHSVIATGLTLPPLRIIIAASHPAPAPIAQRDRGSDLIMDQVQAPPTHLEVGRAPEHHPGQGLSRPDQDQGVAL